MALDYYRRPQLVGKNITRTLNASLRGSVRRLDADFTSPVPYFDTLSAADTLEVTHQAGSVTVTFTGNDLQTVLADLNTALDPDAKAVDNDGTIELQSLVPGYTGLISVTGGTGATALGFETFEGTRPFLARGGQIPSAPEGRLQNPFDVALPSRGENFTALSAQRGMARLAANSDVMWFDHIKNQIQMKTVSFTVSGDNKYIIPTSTQRLFTGLPGSGDLSASSVAKDLIPYFQLIDTATNLPAASQVVAVVRGNPSGEPPFANAPSWTDTTGKNVLGQDFLKVTAGVIDEITEGKNVFVSGATFITSGVVPGDTALIENATNTTRGDNNGLRWVVEEVFTEEVLSLRPMSAAELTANGLALTGSQPLVELNDYLTGGEDYGTISIKNYLFQHNVKLVVRPQIPVNATYELRAAVPTSIHDEAGYETRFSSQPPSLDLVSSLSPDHNGFISGFDFTYNGVDNIDFGAGLIRWHGRVYSIPARTYESAEFAEGANIIYWDDETSTVKITTSLSLFKDLFDPSVTTNKGHLMAWVLKDAGELQPSSQTLIRFIADATRTITVGTGGQFPNLHSCFKYLELYATANSETLTTAGNYPHVDILIVSDTSYDSTNVLYRPVSCTIRGAQKSLQLTLNGYIELSHANDFEIRDLTVVTNATSLIGVDEDPTTGNGNLRIINVAHVGSLTRVVEAFLQDGEGAQGLALGEVLIQDCDFSVADGIVLGKHYTGTGTTVIRSDFDFTGSTSGPMFSNYTNDNWSGYLYVSNCRFTGQWEATGDYLMVGGNESSARITIENTDISLAAHSTTTKYLINHTGPCFVRNVRITEGKIPIAVSCSNVDSYVENCYFLVNPKGTTDAAITAGVIQNCYLAHQNTAVAETQGGIALYPYREAFGNEMTGPWYRAISVNGNELRVINNKILVQASSNATASKSAIYLGTCSNTLIHGNHIKVDASLGGTVPVTSSTIFCVELNTTSESINVLSITGNSFGLAYGGTVVGSSGSPTQRDVLISNNHAYTYVTNSLSNSGLFVDTKLFTPCVISNNRVNLVGGTSSVYYAISMASGTGFDLTVDGNYFRTMGPSFFSAVSDYASLTVSNNIFYGLTTGAGAFGLSTCLIGTVTGNQFIGETSHDVRLVSGIFTSNVVQGTVRLSSTASETVVANNKISILDGATGSPTFSKFALVGNVIQSTLTLTNVANNGHTIIEGNHVGGSVSCSLGTGTMEIESNTFSGAAFFVTTTGNLKLSGCLFNTATLTWSLTVTNDCTVTNNNITPVNGFSAGISSKRSFVSNNNFYGTDLTTASNQATTVTVSGSTNADFSNNYVLGKVSISSENVVVVGNYILNLGGGNGALQVTSVGAVSAVLGNGVISGNSVIQDSSVIAADSNYPALRLPSVHNLRIEGNFFRITSFSASYTGVAIFAVVMIGTSVGLIFSGNIVDKPANATISTFAITCDYVHTYGFGTTQSQILIGNLMSAAGTVGATYRQGDKEYFAGPLTYTLGQ